MFTAILDGGVVLWLIVAGAILALVVFLERLFQVHRIKIKSEDFVRGVCNIMERRNVKEALSICEETPGPVARMVRAAIQRYDQDRQQIAQAIDSTAMTEIALLERRLGVLATVAQVAPLLGLLGTVLGLIKIAILVEQKAPLVQAGDLAGGLWQALIATAAGLGVAILSYASYNFLVIKIDAIALDMKRAAGEISAFFASLSCAARRPAQATGAINSHPDPAPDTLR